MLAIMDEFLSGKQLAYMSKLYQYRGNNAQASRALGISDAYGRIQRKRLLRKTRNHQRLRIFLKEESMKVSYVMSSAAGILPQFYSDFPLNPVKAFPIAVDPMSEQDWDNTHSISIVSRTIPTSVFHVDSHEEFVANLRECHRHLFGIVNVILPHGSEILTPLEWTQFLFTIGYVYARISTLRYFGWTQNKIMSRLDEALDHDRHPIEQTAWRFVEPLYNRL